MKKEMINVNFRINKELKEQMERTCKEIGITMTSAFIIYAKKVVKEGRIPFDLEAIKESYSKENGK